MNSHRELQEMRQLLSGRKKIVVEHLLRARNKCDNKGTNALPTLVELIGWGTDIA